jgi:hypothetical protein
MMPPTISIGDGVCGAPTLSFLSNEEKAEFNSCNGDANKNGVNDYVEKVLPNSKVILEADSLKYGYNNVAPLKVRVVSEN